jgi:uncharacterized protein (DUF2141 family)
MRHLLPLALLLIPTPAPAAEAPLVVAVSGVPIATGRVVVDVCPERQFTKARCLYTGSAPASAGTTLVRVAGVPAGRWAAMAWHDANANGQVDRNMIGMPRELIGFSNDVRVRMSAPRFADAAFARLAGEQRIAFSVRKVP